MDQENRELIERHLPLVEHLVVRMTARLPRHVDRAELSSAGLMGLVEAALRYDPDAGVPFGAFASRRVRGAMLDVLRAQDWAPRSVRATARATEAAEQELASRLHRAPEAVELAAAVGLTAAELDEHRRRVDRGVMMALDEPTRDEGESLVATLADPTASDPLDVVEDREHKGYLKAAVAALPDRHRAVISGYFLEGRTSEELAEELGVTQSRISQLRADALEMLREGIDAQYEAVPSAPPKGRVARRKAAYAAAIASASSLSTRLGAADPLLEASG